MKTFNEKDLITWSNRYDVKVGTEGYFAISITDLKDNIKAGKIYELEGISDKDAWCFTDGTFRYGFFLPVDAVKDEVIYRPCKTIQEFFDLLDLSSLDSKNDEDYIHYLIDETIHIRSKSTGTEYYTSIRSISVDPDGCIKILITRRSYQSFEQIFNNFEIKIDGEWKPFGVIESWSKLRSDIRGLRNEIVQTC